MATEEKKLGDMFIQFGPFFKLYKEYVKNHETAADRVSKLLAPNTKHTKFRDFHTKNHAHPKSKGLALSSLLIMPIQRMYDPSTHPSIAVDLTSVI
jgi:hypothetical protein